jgi:hypothetical protein
VHETVVSMRQMFVRTGASLATGARATVAWRVSLTPMVVREEAR